MIIYLFVLILSTYCVAMDMPVAPARSDQTEGAFCMPLAGQGRFSPDGKKIIVATESQEYYGTVKGDLHIQDVSSGKVTRLEKSTSSALDPKKSYGHDYFKYSWSPSGTLIKAEYFTQIQQIVPGQYDAWRNEQTEEKLPLKVLKVWNRDGKLLYQRHQSWGNKLYFSANDEYLLVKERENPLRVFNARTGALLASLGKPTAQVYRLPVDPHNAWLLQLSSEMQDTYFYNQQNFSYVGHINAHVQEWSADGTVIIAHETQEFDTPNEQTCCSSNNKFLANFCAIYNRQLEKTHRFNCGWMHQFGITPDQKTVISYNHEEQICYDLESKQKVACVMRTHSKDESEFLLDDGSLKIELFPNNDQNCTRIILVKDGTQEVPIKAPKFLNRVFNTRIPGIIALADYNSVKYLFNIETKILIPCNQFAAKSLYKHKPVRFVSQEGHYITKEDKEYTVRKIR